MKNNILDKKLIIDTSKCNRCGLFFDVNNEPVADEGIELSEDEKRKLIVFLIVAGIVIRFVLTSSAKPSTVNA